LVKMITQYQSDFSSLKTRGWYVVVDMKGKVKVYSWFVYLNLISNVILKADAVYWSDDREEIKKFFSV